MLNVVGAPLLECFVSAADGRRVSRVTTPTFGSWLDVSMKLFWRAVFAKTWMSSPEGFTKEHERRLESCKKRSTAAVVADHSRLANATGSIGMAWTSIGEGWRALRERLLGFVGSKRLLLAGALEIGYSCRREVRWN